AARATYHDWRRWRGADPDWCARTLRRACHRDGRQWPEGRLVHSDDAGHRRDHRVCRLGARALRLAGTAGALPGPGSGWGIAAHALGRAGYLQQGACPFFMPSKLRWLLRPGPCLARIPVVRPRHGSRSSRKERSTWVSWIDSLDAISLT